jgi:hypothetical protein
LLTDKQPAVTQPEIDAAPPTVKLPVDVAPDRTELVVDTLEGKVVVPVTIRSVVVKTENVATPAETELDVTAPACTPFRDDKPLTVTAPEETVPDTIELEVTEPACTPFNDDWPLTVTVAEDMELEVTAPACTLANEDDPATVRQLAVMQPLTDKAPVTPTRGLAFPPTVSTVMPSVVESATAPPAVYG